MAGLFPKKDWLDGEELVGKLLSSFGEDRKLNVDVKEFPDRYEVKADLPGFSKEEITVEYDSEILAISAEHSVSKEEEGDDGRYLRKERSTTALRRQFVVKNVAEDQITAAFDMGVLQLTLPKIEADRQTRKKIDIQ